MTNGKTKVVTGLHVVKKERKTNPPIFYVYAWRGGPCIHKSEGRRPVITQAILDSASEARSQHRLALPDTLAWLVEEYKSSDAFTGLGKRTRAEYARWLDRMVEEFGGASLAAFDDRRMRADIIKWKGNWAHQPRSADAAAVMASILLGWGVENAHLAINVAHGIKRVNKVNRADIVWQQSDWDAIAPVASPQLMQALQLASMTGLRLGDLVKLNWEHVGDKSIIFTTSKRNKRAVMPVFSELRTFLDTLPSRIGPVLVNSRGDGWTASGLGCVFQDAKKASGIKVRLHDLRGTYVTWLCKIGLTDEEIARTVGWSTKRIAEIRARYVDEAAIVVSLVERMEKAGSM